MKMRVANQKNLVFILVTLLLALGPQRTSYTANLEVSEPRTVRLIYFRRMIALFVKKWLMQ